MHPLSGTVFEKSSTPLTLWFYAIFIIAQSHSIISVKEFEQHLGVTYKTAWRMLNLIKKKVQKNKTNSLPQEDFNSLLDRIIK